MDYGYSGAMGKSEYKKWVDSQFLELRNTLSALQVMLDKHRVKQTEFESEKVKFKEILH